MNDGMLRQPSVSSARHEEAWHTAGHYARCLRGFTSSHHGVAISRDNNKTRKSTVEQDHRRISEWESEHQMHESVKARSYFRTTTGRSLHALDECMLDDLVVSDSG